MNGSVRMGKLPSPQGNRSHGFCERRSPPTPSQEPAPFLCPACFPVDLTSRTPLMGNPPSPGRVARLLFFAYDSSREALDPGRTRKCFVNCPTSMAIVLAQGQACWFHGRLFLAACNLEKSRTNCKCDGLHLSEISGTRSRLVLDTSLLVSDTSKFVPHCPFRIWYVRRIHSRLRQSLV